VNINIAAVPIAIGHVINQSTSLGIASRAPDRFVGATISRLQQPPRICTHGQQPPKLGATTAAGG
jgi:hypothetical protein